MIDTRGEERFPATLWKPLLAYWFGTLDRRRWFATDAEIDRKLLTEFMGVHLRAATTPPDPATDDPQAVLAAVLALDQLPRNMFRGEPRAFATDAEALVLARAAVDHGLDRAMTTDERLFLYLPFEHTEDLADQERAVALIGALGDDEYTRYAVAHRDVIRRFGRFPHRNEILGRISTAEETAFLAEPGSRF